MTGRALMILAVVVSATTAPMFAADAASTPAAASAASTVLAAMDRKTDPCQNFYRYACGGWLDTTQIPADQSRWGRGFSVIGERNREALREILEASSKDAGGDVGRAKLGAYYSACMDVEAIDKAGFAPLAPWLAEIEKAQDAKSALLVAAKLQSIGVSAFFGLRADGDFKNPDMVIAFFSQGGLGLPDRDYYLKDDDKSKQTRADYQEHVTKMLQLLGETEDAARRHTGQIVAFETELAKVARPRAELRDPDKTYHKLDLDGLQKLTPTLPWAEFLKAIGHPDVKEINVTVPEFFEGLQTQLRAADAETLQAYLRWGLVRSTAPLLSAPFVDESFAFFGKKLAGQKEQQARWKRCVEATDRALGELLGQQFVEKHFAGDSKSIAVDMVGRIESAFESNLPALSWMDDATRTRAVGKKQALKNKIGYPDKWRDYSKLAVKKGNYFASAIAARNFEFEFRANKIGKPMDKAEWNMTPPTVNASYNPLLNEMVFPAGILQPPFFDRTFPMPMNFGGIGMVMGHELTHGFDDQGRKFDPSGKLTEWWEPAVSAKFEERAQCVSNLYSSYEVQPGLKINGQLTLGENIADLGGIKEAYSAYKRWAEEHPEQSRSAVEGLTNDQLFFVGFAQTWCSIQTPEIERMLVTVDPHSHPRYRVMGPLSNFDAFAQAFQCGEGTPMNPKDSCQVW